MGPEKQSLELQCANNDCRQSFVVEIPLAEIVNSMTLSAVVWAHPDGQSCPHCGATYQMRILKVDAPTIRFDPVRMRGDAKRIVIPPAGMKLPGQN